MPYDLMLLADPGPERSRVLEVLNGAGDIRPDPELDNRFWLQTSAGEAQVNIGTKDPVESVHVEFEFGDPDLSEAVTRRALSLAEELEMRIEDMQFGYEIGPEDLPKLKQFWKELRPAAPVPEKAARKPWWKPW